MFQLEECKWPQGKPSVVITNANAHVQCVSGLLWRVTELELHIIGEEITQMPRDMCQLKEVWVKGERNHNGEGIISVNLIIFHFFFICKQKSCTAFALLKTKGYNWNWEGNTEKEWERNVLPLLIKPDLHTIYLPVKKDKLWKRMVLVFNAVTWCRHQTYLCSAEHTEVSIQKCRQQSSHITKTCGLSTDASLAVPWTTSKTNIRDGVCQMRSQTSRMFSLARATISPISGKRHDTHDKAHHLAHFPKPTAANSQSACSTETGGVRICLSECSQSLAACFLGRCDDSVILGLAGDKSVASQQWVECAVGCDDSSHPPWLTTGWAPDTSLPTQTGAVMAYLCWVSGMFRQVDSYAFFLWGFHHWVTQTELDQWHLLLPHSWQGLQEKQIRMVVFVKNTLYVLSREGQSNLCVPFQWNDKKNMDLLVPPPVVQVFKCLSDPHKFKQRKLENLRKDGLSLDLCLPLRLFTNPLKSLFNSSLNNPFGAAGVSERQLSLKQIHSLTLALSSFHIFPESELWF